MLINDLAVTGSFTVNGSPVQSTITGSLATTGSNSFTGSQSISGSLTTTGNITAQTLIVNVVSSSITYSSGSNIFGNLATNVQQMTGSLRVTGSGNHWFETGNLGVGSTNPTVKLEVVGDYRQKALVGNSNGFNVSINSSTDVVSLINYYNAGLAFGVNNAEGVRLTTTGLGIGTTSPLSALDVRAASAVNGNYQTIQAFSTDSAAINLGGGISLGGYYSGISSIAQFASIWGRKENSTSGNYDGYLAFGTNSQATGVRELMRLNSSGNLGLGVTASAWDSGFTVAQIGTGGSVYSANSNRNIYLATNAYYASGFKYVASDFAGISGWEDGSYVWLIAASGTAGNAISFTQAMTLNASGNLGIGTSSPTTYSGYTTLALNGSSGGAIEFKKGDTQQARITNAGDAVLQFVTNNSEAMRITSAGLVGIGTTSPSTLLYVNGYSSSNWITTLNNTGTSGHQLYFGYNDGTSTRYGLYIDGGPGSGSGNFDFGIGASKLRVMSGGNVGIGTSSPSTLLEVSGAQDGVSGKSLRLSYNGTYYADYTEKSIRVYNNEFIIGTGASGTERMRITSAGDVVVGGTSAINSTTGRGNITINGTTSILNFGISNVESGYIYHNGTNLDVAQVLAQPLRFLTTNTERMRIRSGGEVSFLPTTWNYSSPSTAYRNMDMGAAGWLFRDASDAYLTSNFYYNASSQAIAKYASNDGIGGMTLSGGKLVWSTYNGSVTAGSAYSTTERFIITTAGDVGIGITSDNPISNGGTYRNLLVGNGAGYGAFQGVSTATATNSTIVSFSGGTTGASGFKNAGAFNVELDGTSTTNATGRLVFYTGAGGSINERMRITATANFQRARTSEYDSLVSLAQNAQTTFLTVTTNSSALVRVVIEYVASRNNSGVVDYQSGRYVIFYRANVTQFSAYANETLGTSFITWNVSLSSNVLTVQANPGAANVSSQIVFRAFVVSDGGGTNATLS